MAVTKALIKTIPHVTSNRVEQWEMEIKYENDAEGDATYYTTTFSTTVEATDHDGNTIFTKKAKDLWTKSELEALLPISNWDAAFDSQVDTVITNPVIDPIADESFSIPS